MKGMIRVLQLTDNGPPMNILPFGIGPDAIHSVREYAAWRNTPHEKKHKTNDFRLIIKME
jgi:hypothetical protein